MTSDTLPPAGDSFSMCIIIVAEYHSVIFLFDYHYSAKKWSIVIDIHDVDDDDDGMKVEDDVGIDNICNVICSITVITAHLMSDAFNHQQHCKPEIHSRQIDIGIDVACNVGFKETWNK